MKLLLFCLFIMVLNLAVDFNNCVVLWDYAERYFINFFCYYSAQRLTSFSAKATYFLWSHHFSPLFIHPPFSSDFSFSFRRTAISKAWLYLVGLFYIAICLVPSSSGAKGTRITSGVPWHKERGVQETCEGPQLGIYAGFRRTQNIDPQEFENFHLCFPNSPSYLSLIWGHGRVFNLAERLISYMLFVLREGNLSEPQIS